MGIALSRRGLRPLNRPGLWYGIAYSILLLVAILSLIPSPNMGVSDKLLHFIAYFALSAGFTTLNQHAGKLIAIALGLILYGVLLEILQGLTGYRMMDGMDMLANSAGVVTGLLVWLTPLPPWFRELEVRLLKKLHQGVRYR